MIHIYCGEDSATARKEFSNALQAYERQGYEVRQLTSALLLELPKGLAESVGLFSEKRVFAIDNVEKQGLKKSTKSKKNALYDVLVSFADDKSVEILTYEEEKPARLLKLKDVAVVHESKPAVSIFQFVEQCVPGNKKKFIDMLRLLEKDQEPLFIFIMLSRHIRQVVLASKNALPAKTPPWQKFKVQAAAKKWSEPSLMGFYEGMIKLEMGVKSSSNPYGIARSIEILACHYL